MKKKFGFTLAEVLITLGIIGVVAAMTIPTLIANTNSARFRSQFKKSISTLSQAGLMAQAQYDIDYSTNDSATACNPSDDPDVVFNFCAIFNGTLSGHTLSANIPLDRNGEDYTEPFDVDNARYLTLADGSLVVFNGAAHGCTKGVTQGLNAVPEECYGYIDVNGTTLPNRPVLCADGTQGNDDGVDDNNGENNDDNGGDNNGAGFFGQPAYAENEGGGEAGGNTITVTRGNCQVPNDANHMRDVFPIVFHDGTVEPASSAARYVLTTAK